MFRHTKTLTIRAKPVSTVFAVEQMNRAKDSCSEKTDVDDV